MEVTQVRTDLLHCTLQTILQYIIIKIVLLDDEDSTAEKKEEKLRSILAQLEYTYRGRSWDEKGVPFCTYMYVPERHPITGTPFHEREDEGHVLKVCWMTWECLTIF